jgi:hypothetical protein
VREIDGESVLLHLDSATYYGLDEVGTRFGVLLAECGSVGMVFDILLAEFEVAPEVLRRDLDGFVSELIACGLLESKETP